MASLRRNLLKELKARRRNFSVDEIMKISEHELAENQDSFNIDSVVMSQIIQQLSLRQREVVYLKFYHGIKINQIAQVMEITPQSASNTLQKAIIKLRKLAENKRMQNFFQ